MNTMKIAAFALLSFIGVLWAATYTVSKDGRGAYSSVQAAVNAAAADGSGAGDIVKILDNAVYEEQVSIPQEASGLLLTSSNPVSLTKPTIRYQDRSNVHPKFLRRSAGYLQHELRSKWCAAGDESAQRNPSRGLKSTGAGTGPMVTTESGGGVPASAPRRCNTAMWLWVYGSPAALSCAIAISPTPI